MIPTKTTLTPTTTLIHWVKTTSVISITNYMKYNVKRKHLLRQNKNLINHHKIINYSKRPLIKHETDMLNLGLKFNPTSPRTKNKTSWIPLSIVSFQQRTIYTPSISQTTMDTPPPKITTLTIFSP